MVDSKMPIKPRNAKKTYLFIGIGAAVAFSVIAIIFVVVLFTGKGNVNKEEEKYIPKTPFESYIYSKKALYVWDYYNGQNFIQFLTDHNFSKIYFYIGCLGGDYENLINQEFVNTGDSYPKELIKKIIEKKIEVDLLIYLNDDPNDFANIENMPNIAKALGELQKTLKFNALHFYIVPENEKNYEALLKMYEDCRKYIKVSAILRQEWLNVTMTELESNFTSSDYYKKFKDCDTYADAIMTVTDSTDLLVNSNTYDGVDSILKQYDAIRERHPSNIAKPILKLDPAKTNEGLILRYNDDKDKFFNYFVNVSKRYDGATINQYLDWYQDLYCERPHRFFSYYFGTPKDC